MVYQTLYLNYIYLLLNYFSLAFDGFLKGLVIFNVLKNITCTYFFGLSTISGINCLFGPKKVLELSMGFKSGIYRCCIWYYFPLHYILIHIFGVKVLHMRYYYHFDIFFNPFRTMQPHSLSNYVTHPSFITPYVESCVKRDTVLGNCFSSYTCSSWYQVSLISSYCECYLYCIDWTTRLLNLRYALFWFQNFGVRLFAFS